MSVLKREIGVQGDKAKYTADVALNENIKIYSIHARRALHINNI